MTLDNNKAVATTVALFLIIIVIVSAFAFCGCSRNSAFRQDVNAMYHALLVYPDMAEFDATDDISSVWFTRHFGLHYRREKK